MQSVVKHPPVCLLVWGCVSKSPPSATTNHLINELLISARITGDWLIRFYLVDLLNCSGD